jgi:hypothetical protein
MCYIDGQKNKYSVLNECNRVLKYNILLIKCYDNGPVLIFTLPASLTAGLLDVFV